MKSPDSPATFFQTELIAGIIGALLVIPQAISFSILAGVDPEYGLYCTMYMGLIASLLGQSPIISGPNTAVAILVGTTLAQFATPGSGEYTQNLALLTLMVTACQFAFYVFRWHRIFDFISPVTIKAISTCIGILLIVSSLDGVLGVPGQGPQPFYQKLLAIPSKVQLANPYAFCVAATTIVTGLLSKLWWSRYYLPIALVCGLAAGIGIDQFVAADVSQMARLSAITISAMPFHLPDLSWVELSQVKALALPSIAIAYLGLSQTLVIAKGIEATPGIDDIGFKASWRSLVATRISLRREVLAQAAGNLSSVFLGSYPGSGSFNRTMVNLAVGSKTKVAGILSTVFVWVLVMAFADILAILPMAVIYGSLLIVGVGMIKRSEIEPIMRQPKERWLFIVVIGTLLFLGLTAGIAVALVLSVALLAMSSSTLDWQVAEDERQALVRGPLNYVTARSFEQRLDQLFGHRPQLADCQLDIRGLIIAESSFATPIEDILAPYKAKGLAITQL